MPTLTRNLTVADLRKRLDGVPDDTPIAQWGHRGGPYAVQEFCYDHGDKPGEYLEELYLHKIGPENTTTAFPVGTNVFIVSEQDG